MKVSFKLASELCNRFGLGYHSDWLRKELEVAEGDSVRQLLVNLVTDDSRFDGHLYDRSAGTLGKDVWLVLNGRIFNPDDTSSLDTRLSPGDRVTVVPSPEG